MVIRHTPSPPAVALSQSPSRSNRIPSGRPTFASFAADKVAATRLVHTVVSARPVLFFVLAAIVGTLLLCASDHVRGGIFFARQTIGAEDAAHEARLAAAVGELRRVRGEGRAEEVLAAQEAVMARQQTLLRRYRQQLTRLGGALMAGQTAQLGAGHGGGTGGESEVGGGNFVATRHEGCAEGDLVPREEVVAEGERLDWQPQEGAYLLATCVYGRATNRLLCLRNYVLAATLLRRTLIVPTVDLYPAARRWNKPGEPLVNFEALFNASHLTHCFHRPVAVSLRDHLRSTNSSTLVVNRFVCWAPRCAFPRGRPSLPALRFSSMRQAGLEPTVTLRTFVDAYAGVGGRVLCLGDIFESHARFLDPPPGFTSSLSLAWAMPPHPLTPALHATGVGDASAGRVPQVPAAVGVGARCGTVLWPHDAVVQAAVGFVREVSGRRFAALHVRRDDMFRHCVTQGKCPYWAQRQAGECVRHKLLGEGFQSLMNQQEQQQQQQGGGSAGGVSVGSARPLLFLASDTSDDDLAVFLSALQGLPLPPPAHDNTTATTVPATATNGVSLPSLDAPEAVTVVRLPSLEGKMWAERLNREGMASEAGAMAAVEKMVCALARLFLGTPGSTFSQHIMHLRRALHTASCLDGGFCRGLMAPEID